MAEGLSLAAQAIRKVASGVVNVIREVTVRPHADARRWIWLLEAVRCVPAILLLLNSNLVVQFPCVLLLLLMMKDHPVHLVVVSRVEDRQIAGVVLDEDGRCKVHAFDMYCSVFVDVTFC